MKRSLVAILFISLSVIASCAINKTFYTEDGKTAYTVTDKSEDPVGYVTIFRVKIHALIGIPYGHQGQAMFFTSREACEHARHNMQFRPASLAAVWEKPETPPSTECERVHYRRQDLPDRPKPGGLTFP